MKNGDISNHQSLTFGVRLEESLLYFKDRTFFNRLGNLLLGKAKRATVNEKLLSIMNYIYWNTEYTVVLIVDKENYTKELESYLSDFPFNRIGCILKSLSEVTAMLNVGELSYYVTDNETERGLINSKYAITPEELSTLVRRRIKRFEET